MKSKKDMAEFLVSAGLLSESFDYALPQGWLDQFTGAAYDRVLSSHVWAYPKGSAFGEPVDIVALYNTTVRPVMTVEVVEVPASIYGAVKEQVPWLFGAEDADTTPLMFTRDELSSAVDNCEDGSAKDWLENELKNTSKWALVAFVRPDVDFSNYYQLFRAP